MKDVRSRMHKEPTHCREPQNRKQEVKHDLCIFMTQISYFTYILDPDSGLNLMLFLPYWSYVNDMRNELWFAFFPSIISLCILWHMVINQPARPSFSFLVHLWMCLRSVLNWAKLNWIKFLSSHKAREKKLFNEVQTAHEMLMLLGHQLANRLH